ncbi:hypothetical protein ACFYM2_04965 [Streptomyces sp. NPDC006711]|uniref:hypothetical protein n=1 Tax=Streptomyces sp. NPDC006711 TaxID=3364762 RepID=UPI0036AFF53C
MYDTIFDDEDWAVGSSTLVRRPSARERGYRPSRLGQLSALRREIKAEAIARRKGLSITTDLYALGVEPVNSLLRAQVYAEGEGFTVRATFQ